MKTYRSRNRISNTSNSIDIKSSFISNTLKLEDKENKKNKILSNLTEYAGEARAIIQNNNLLKHRISELKKNNTYTKNLINKIITINKDIKFKLKKHNNTNDIHLYKENLFNCIKEYNDYIRNNNNILNEKIKKEKEKNEKYNNDLNLEIGHLNETLEESINLNFMLDNRNKYKESIIRVLADNYENIGCIQEIIRYRFVNDEMNQQDIDKYYSKHLSIFQQSLLNITQSWNKYKNRAIKFEQEIENLQKILENPEIYEKQKKNVEKKDEEYNSSFENDLFLLTFDEFEDESKDFSLDNETLTTNPNEDNSNIKNNSNLNLENNINIKTNANNNINYIKVNNYNKINTNVKHNKINPAKSQNQNIRRLNKINFNKRDIYYIPQNDFSRSLIRNSESVKKIMPKERINVCSQIPISNRNVSINSISKLNLKQIVFNKNNKFIKEEAKEMAIKRYKIENEYKDDITNNYENPNEIKLQLEIKDIKKDIKRFKEKIMRKKKIIKEFKLFCKDILQKYDIYINNNKYNTNFFDEYDDKLEK